MILQTVKVKKIKPRQLMLILKKALVSSVQTSFLLLVLLI